MLLALLLCCSLAAVLPRLREPISSLPRKASQTSQCPSFRLMSDGIFQLAFFRGDTHLHTAVSVDAGTMCRLGQEDAYRFARGEEAAGYGIGSVAAVWFVQRLALML